MDLFWAAASYIYQLVVVGVEDVDVVGLVGQVGRVVDVVLGEELAVVAAQGGQR